MVDEEKARILRDLTGCRRTVILDESVSVSAPEPSRAEPASKVGKQLDLVDPPGSGEVGDGS